ncbi:unnamed protein product [Aureobasidium uvarum]|uniref:Uncharacterized protein n=1 Tax=Aureobasidium uvarum TaxID=2773716 RepID=A0A9N8PRG7_9PEZI|nr:unnamed protein product [Aureobasidium uvarum]
MAGGAGDMELSRDRESRDGKLANNSARLSSQLRSFGNMASLVDTAITTSHEIPTNNPGKFVVQQDPVEKKKAERPGVQPPKKYRHTFAVHCTTRPSCLSQDSAAPTSFTGFRNLGALVISQYPATTTVFIVN